MTLFFPQLAIANLNFATAWNWISIIYSCSQKHSIIHTHETIYLIFLPFIHLFIHSSRACCFSRFRFDLFLLSFRFISELKKRTKKEMFAHSFDEQLMNSIFFLGNKLTTARKTPSHQIYQMFTLPEIVYLSTSASIWVSNTFALNGFWTNGQSHLKSLNFFLDINFFMEWKHFMRYTNSNL